MSDKLRSIDSSEFRKEILLVKDDFECLWNVAVKYRDKGMDQDTMYNELGKIILELRAKGDEDSEDRVTDLSDYVCGWCNPVQRLYKDEK